MPHDTATRPHSRQRRPEPNARGWLSTREYAALTGCAWSSVRRWCAMGSVPNSKGLPVPVDGGDGRDYRIPLAALS